MEISTLGRDYLKKDVIDNFHSVIWTERYYGDSEVELVVEESSDMISKLPVGIFLGLDGSDEIMILEEMNLEGEGKVKYTGIGILPWLNNRFVRTTASHENRYWYIDGQSPGFVLWAIVYNMCCVGSPYLNGTNPTNIANPEKLAIVGLGLDDYDTSDPPVKIGVPYGPVYDALNEIATTFEIGMQIKYDVNGDSPLAFRSYKGLDRSSGQSTNSVVRFSPEMDSLTNIKELQSIAALKTIVYTFAPGLNPAEGETEIRTTPGVAALTGSQYTGFDLRASMVFADDITTDQVGGSSSVLLSILNNRAKDELKKGKYVKMVDGEIVPENQFQYGIHYNLGDIVEVEGKTGTIMEARVTEYIRSKDAAGEKAYPTLTAIE